MNELVIMNFNGIETVDSRQVAEAVEKNHKELLRDIRKYCEYLTESKIALSEFFIESFYQDSTGRTLPCYQITRKGCEMIANKMTGQKGTVFTALYVNAFHAMENHIKQEKKASPNAEKRLDIQAKNAEARVKNVQTKQEQILFGYYKELNLSPESFQLLCASAYKRMTGEEFPLALPETEKTWSAGEVGEMLGVSANKIGRTANAHGLKTDEYGIMVLDTAQNGKQIPTFRYNQHGIDKLKELLKN